MTRRARKIPPPFACAACAACVFVAQLVACGTPPKPTEPAAKPNAITVGAEHEARPQPLTEFAGSYRLAEASAPSGCGGKIILAARNLTVDPRKGTVHADVVDRTYAAEVKDGTLIAEGRFSVSGACSATFIFERWTLTRDGNGRLVGELESLWELPPDCEKPCLVRIPIVATPS